MLRSYFCCNRCTDRLSKLDNLDTLSFREVLDVEVATCRVSNHSITRCHRVFCYTSRTANLEVFPSNVLIESQYTVQLWIFFVETNEGPQTFGFFQGLTDYLGTLQRDPII